MKRSHKNPKTLLLGSLTVAAILIGLTPLAGLWLFGLSAAPYLEFPPHSRFIEPPPFAPVLWLLGALFSLLLFYPLLRGLLLPWRRLKFQRRFPFPLFGWTGLLLLALGWLISWTRWAAPFPWQYLAFTVLWSGYVVTVNAMIVMLRGRAALGLPAGQLALFPLSAAFWWSYEYLNRFTQNWSYVNAADLDPLEYLVFTTLAFSTVLPAVMVTKELLDVLGSGSSFQNLKPLSPLSRPAAAGLLAGALLVLLCLPAYPQLLFPLLWVAPLVVLTACQRLAAVTTVFSGLCSGDAKSLALWAGAALFCGFWWEFWNWGSYAHWVYHIPYVGGFKLFAMPLLGYGGYLPFGILCGALIQAAEQLTGPPSGREVAAEP